MPRLSVQAYRWMTLFAGSSLLLLMSAAFARGGPAIGHVSSSIGSESSVALLLAILVAPVSLVAIARAGALSFALARTGGAHRARVIFWYGCLAYPLLMLLFATAGETPVWFIALFPISLLLAAVLPIVWWLQAIRDGRRSAAV